MAEADGEGALDEPTEEREEAEPLLTVGGTAQVGEVEGSTLASAEVAAAPVEEGEEAPPPAESTNGAAAETKPDPIAAAPVAPAPVPAEPEEQESGTGVSEVFSLARQQNFPAAAKLLDAYPQHWTAVDDEGHSLLHWASLVGNKEFVLSALSKHCEVNAQANNKQTPLMWAVLRGHVAVARTLLDAKADMQHHDSLGATALMIAVQHRNYPCILLLMHRGKEALLGDSDKNGCTAAHWAAYKGDMVSLKLLDYFGADLVATDNAGMLPLHRATCASEESVIEWLVEKRSDPTLRNKEGKSCLDLAEDQHSLHLQALFKRLQKKGPDKLEEDIEAASGTDLDAKKKEGIFKSITKDKAAQKLFPVFWIVCVSLALFEYLMDLRATSYEVAPTASRLFELGVPLSLAIFFYVALTDPGKLPARTRGSTGVEELMRAIDGGAPEGKEPDLSRLCTTTWVLKDLRTKYCAQTGACVEEFDHYCVWLNTSIGKANHRQFVCLAVTEWLTQLVHIKLCLTMARALVPYTSIGGWLLGVVTGYPLLTIITLVQCLTVPWVLMLIIHQVRLVTMNLTTNELMNMHRYEHFWVAGMLEPGRLQKIYRNPFNKGGVVKNCLDFWWRRRRSQMGELSPVTSHGHSHGGGGHSQCCHDHGSGHGQSHGHGHGHGH